MGAEANKAARTKAELLAENEELRARLDEAEQTLDAIRSGEVDALVVAGPLGDQVFSLTGAERTYRLIVETMNEAALTVDLSGGILFCNRRFSELMRCPLAEAIGRKITDFVALAQKSPMQKLLATAQAGPVQRSLTLRAADGAAVSVQLAASPLLDAGNASICLVATDLTELEAQADSIRFMHEHQQALEESRAELQAANASLSQSRLAALNVSEDAIAARRQAEELAAHLQHEVTERKQAEELLQSSLREKEVLLKEIHHRVKNNMQVISSLVNLQANSLNNPALTEVFHDLRDRVRSMALVHEKLYCSGNLFSVDFAEYATSLLQQLWRAHNYSADSVTLTLALEQVLLSVDLAVPCGLILNELAINALKHAFKGRSNGEFTVTLSSGPAAGVCLMVSDNGVGMPAELDWRQAKSLGLNLVQMLAKQLKAQVEVRNNNGTEFRITFNSRNAKALAG